MGNLKLYELSDQYRALERLGEEECSDEDELEAIRNTLDGLTGEIKDKAVAIGAYVLNVEAYAQAAHEASARLAERAKRIQRRADALREHERMHLEATGITKIDSPEFTIAIRKNPVRVDIATGARIPAEFMVTPPPPPPHPDKGAIRQALQGGEDIPGCSLSQTTRLDIRT